jgi:hypothetical protein
MQQSPVLITVWPGPDPLAAVVELQVCEDPPKPLLSACGFGLVIGSRVTVG